MLGTVYLRLPLDFRRGLRGVAAITLGSLVASVAWGVARSVHVGWFFAGAFDEWPIVERIAGAGWPYRVFVCAFGVLVATLSATGVWIWWRKRVKRRRRVV